MAFTYYVDGSAGNDTNDGKTFGAAFATIGKLASTMADGDTGVICNTATYTLGATVTWNVAGTAANGGLTITGGNATGTVDGTQALITSSTNSVALFTLSGATFHRFKNLRFWHTAATKGDAFVCATTAPSNIVIESCTIGIDGSNAANGCANGFNGSTRDCAGLWIIDTYIANSTASGVTNGATGPSGVGMGIVINDSTIYNCTGSGYSTNTSSSTVKISRSVIAKNGAKGIYDTGTSRNNYLCVDGCTICTNTGDGIRSDESTGSFTLEGSNNLIYGNGGYGVYMTPAQANVDARKSFHHNAYGGNTSGNLYHVTAGVGDVTGLNDPFTSSAGQDWSLNVTAGAGLAARAVGFPGTLRNTSTTGYRDIGAVQHRMTSTQPHGTLAQNLYAGATVTDSSTTTGTLAASNIATAKGSGDNLAAADLRYGKTVDDIAGAIEMPNSGTPTGTQDATSDACVVSGKKYGSPQRTGSAAGGGNVIVVEDD